jgi:hypothetical protein
MFRYERRQGKQELLFVNKKKQKNFIRFSAGLFSHRAKRSKSFLVLFFKKERLNPSVASTAPAGY